MHDISPDARRLVEESVPEFVTAVQRAKEVAAQKHTAAKLKLTLDAFEDDPILLYACIWYGGTLGVACTFLPIVRTDDTQALNEQG